MYSIQFFTTDHGKKPTEEFLLSLDEKMRVKVLRNMQHLQIHGPRLREPYSKPLGDGIFELRTQASGNITRVLYFFYVGHRIVVTHGFIKKTMKTPLQEIERAKAYRKIFLEREEKGHRG